MKHAVLVAEDDRDDAFLLERALRRINVDVLLEFVRDGQEALDYLAGQEEYADRVAHPFPQMILLDLKMPRLGGFDVLERLNRNPKLRPQIVTVLSSSDLPEDKRRAAGLGADHYLTKPSSQTYEKIVERVSEILDGSK